MGLEFFLVYNGKAFSFSDPFKFVTHFFLKVPSPFCNTTIESLFGDVNSCTFVHGYLNQEEKINSGLSILNAGSIPLLNCSGFC